MKSIVLLLFFSGLMFIIVGYQKQLNVLPNPKIEYRYIPRTFYDEQLSSGNVLKQFSSLFENENPWIKDRNIEADNVKDKSNFFN
jgi:hypothetical protein